MATHLAKLLLSRVGESATTDREVIDQFRLMLNPGRMIRNSLVCAECEQFL